MAPTRRSQSFNSLYNPKFNRWNRNNNNMYKSNSDENYNYRLRCTEPNHLTLCVFFFFFLSLLSRRQPATARCECIYIMTIHLIRSLSFTHHNAYRFRCCCFVVYARIWLCSTQRHMYSHFGRFFIGMFERILRILFIIV